MLMGLQTSSDYGPYLANEASPLHTTTLVERCTAKLVDDWNRMRCNVSLAFSTSLFCLPRGAYGKGDARLCR